MLFPTIPFIADTHTVIVNVFNNGANRIDTVNINWSVNGVVQTPIVFADSIEPGTVSNNATLGDFTFSLSTAYTIQVWTTLPNGSTDSHPSNDTLGISNIYAGLSGIYTIGGTTPDFVNFTNAVMALNNGGVAGPVTFLVRDGTYSEQLTINQLQGASAVNTVTFQSENGE